MTDMLWWLSFADESRPRGQRFLGVAIVEAEDELTAVRKTHALGINPGGSVLINGGPEVAEEVAEKGYPRDRLLSRAELTDVLSIGEARAGGAHIHTDTICLECNETEPAKKRGKK
jgi:hypothetical protein